MSLRLRYSVGERRDEMSAAFRKRQTAMPFSVA